MITNKTTEAIDKFTSIVTRASQARSKDIRIDISDAISLMAEISNILSRLAIINTQTTKNPMMDGGKF